MKRLASTTYGLLERHEQKQLWLLVLLMIAQACMEVVSIGSILPFMGLLERPDAIHSIWFTKWAYETLGFTNDRSFLIFSGVVVLTLFLSVNVVNTLSLWAQARFSWMRSFSISRRLFEAYLSQSYLFFLQRNSADFTRNIYREVQQIVIGIILPSVMLISKLISVFLILLLLLYINWSISLGLAALFAGTYAMVFLLSRKALTRISERIVQANEESFRVTNEAFQGIKEAKLGGLESAYVEAFSPPGFMVARMSARRVVFAGTPRYLLECIAFGGMLAIVLILLGTDKGVSEVIPTVSVFAFAGYRLMPALSQIFTAVANIRSSTASLDVVVNDMKSSSQNQRPVEDAERISLSNEIVLKNLSYRYGSNGTDVLNGINLTIRRGETVAFVGPTGAGKTTLIDILLGLLEPTAGTISVDELVINHRNVRGWQKDLGYVPQHIFLSDNSIAKNIALGSGQSSIDVERVKTAATISGMHDFISNELPEGYDTGVGERGVRLSGGQIQRIGIARAVYKDPDVLVLDEATSALDSRTEGQVMDGIRSQANDRTVIIIAHRLSTVRFCDRIVVMDSGSVSDIGTWDELMDRSELFRKLAGEHDADIQQDA